VLAEIAAANAAFQVIKSAIKNSGEIASAGKADCRLLLRDK
jgi:hypothetical protein